jgi:hypothetical protein
VYQFSRAVGPYLRQSFDDVEEEFVPFNILPARVFRCTKVNGKQPATPDPD